ncbi:RHS repeat-associated core domain-containing protein [Chitinophaga pinensis]|uniref:RHS repeat-associated core domain-containing protein n=1 Tax=Chitinophaga pinensis TaxID=79329 RepID=UPI0005C68765
MGSMGRTTTKSKEWNQQDYGMRVYDPRVGKFLSIDPLTQKYPELTPYQFASNRPIDGIDIDGLEWGLLLLLSEKIPSAKNSSGVY